MVRSSPNILVTGPHPIFLGRSETTISIKSSRNSVFPMVVQQCGISLLDKWFPFTIKWSQLRNWKWCGPCMGDYASLHFDLQYHMDPHICEVSFLAIKISIAWEIMLLSLLCFLIQVMSNGQLDLDLMVDLSRRSFFFLVTFKDYFALFLYKFLVIFETCNFNFISTL